MFHLEYHWSPTLLFPSVGLRYLSHCRTPLPRCCMERVLIALVVAAICAVLYYVQLCWVSVMQCLLAFVPFFFYCLRCARFQVSFNPVESGFNSTDLTIEPGRSDFGVASCDNGDLDYGRKVIAPLSTVPRCPNQGDLLVSPRVLQLLLQLPPTLRQ